MFDKEGKGFITIVDVQRVLKVTSSYFFFFLIVSKLPSLILIVVC